MAHQLLRTPGVYQSSEFNRDLFSGVALEEMVFFTAINLSATTWRR
jgi:hypothetical protein